MNIHRLILVRCILVSLFLLALQFHNVSPASAGTGDLTQKDYRWYQNVNAVQPTTALAAQNTAITGVANEQVIRLRINVNNAVSNLASGTTFKLQFSTSTGGPWTDVGGIGTGVIWWGYDNATPADGAAISAVLLTTSSPSDKQTYEEANNATSPGIAKNKVAEWDWVVQNNWAFAGTTYYFRMVLSDGTAFAAYTNYPQVTTTSTPSITVSISDTTADFGSNLDPLGTNSNSTDTVLDYQGSAGNQGSYYVWKESGGAGLTVTVKSNRSWNGKVEATENGGTATSMAIASGVLRYSEGTEPTSYAAASSATALTVSATANSWKSSVANGNWTYTHYYTLRVNWDDDPGTFSSSVTYTVIQI